MKEQVEQLKFKYTRKQTGFAGHIYPPLPVFHKFTLRKNNFNRWRCHRSRNDNDSNYKKRRTRIPWHENIGLKVLNFINLDFFFHQKFFKKLLYLKNF